ncbi:MAG: FliI/YscN family ATPase [Planctomycetes bacterium]|nr:FliI/YscN family ATPase [Planctomycetota bacterium]
MNQGPSSRLGQQIEAAAARANAASGVARVGRVTAVTGTVIRAELPDVRVGEIVRIARRDGGDLEAQAVGFDKSGVLLMALGRAESVEANARVVPAAQALKAPTGEAARGRVLDALGRPIDGRGELTGQTGAVLTGEPPHPLRRARIRTPLTTGVRAIDACLTIGRGQRVGIFAAAGVGKSTLLSTIARHVEADLIVLALVGERGREVAGFIEDDLGPQGLERAAVVVSTSDQPALLRLKAAHTAMAIAESARANGQHVVLLMDSVTRFARALREVGLAAGEPPGRQGYPASVFAELPRMFERAGNDEKGSITAFFTVLVAGDDLEEPVADETLSLLDGHILLSRVLASRGHYPAIDVVRSKSRVMDEIASAEHLAAAQHLTRIVSTYERNYDKISLNVYERGADPEVDEAIERIGDAERFLRQNRAESVGFSDTISRLMGLFT